MTLQVPAGLAFGTLGAGTSEGQIKILKLKSLEADIPLDGVSFLIDISKLLLQLTVHKVQLILVKALTTKQVQLHLYGIPNSWWI